jgi:tetratricopeptide (TPR) repeat protein
MNPRKKHKSQEEILKQQQQSNFVGREKQITLFRRNLELLLQDERRRFIFNVWGQGGVGKTTLLRQFRTIAEEAKAIAAYTDEGEKSVPEVMASLAKQLEQQGHKLEKFSECYKIYRQKQQELESDPEVPLGLSAFLGQTVAQGGVHLVRQVPGTGVVFKFVEQAWEWSAFVTKKLTNKDEVRLLLEPLAVLTPLFLEEIGKLADNYHIALFFDTYERTEEFLDNWLKDILDGRYGEVPLNIILIIAGRQELDKNHWAFYEGSIACLPLEPFTKEEAQEYLTRKGITNSHVIDTIISLSGCLPLLVATLAAEVPHHSSQVGDPRGTAIEHFLKWVEDPTRRQAVVNAAIPQCLNRDILAKLREKQEADGLFNWLKEMPFVKERPNGWVYHDVIKTQILHYKRLSSPQSWVQLHGKLADYYDTLRNDLQLDEQKKWRDQTWQSHTLNLIYHRLCQSPLKYLPLALNGFLAALKNQRSFAHIWAETMVQAGKDADTDEVQHWGEKLVEGLKANNENRYDVVVDMFTALLSHANLDAQWRLVALDWRGYIYSQTNKYSKALEDMTEAINLAPYQAEYLAVRGKTYYSIQRYQEALQDFNRAIELNPNLDWVLAIRGLTYRSIQHYQEALQDFNRAIELNPNLDWVMAIRGDTYRLTQCYEEALQDFNRTIELDFNLDLALASRGETYRLMQRYQEALLDFDRAIEINPNFDWALASRGQTYQSMQRYEQALKDLDRAIRLNPNNPWALASRGQNYCLMQRYEQALKNFDRAIKLNPNNAWALAGRGETYRLMQRYEEALKDFDRAIILNPSYAWALVSRGEIYLMLKRYNDTLIDFKNALELESNNNWCLYVRALTYQALNKPDKAQADFALAIQLAKQHFEQHAQDWRNTFNLALYFLAVQYIPIAKQLYQYALSKGASLEHIHEAIRDLDDFLTVFPEHVQAKDIQKFLRSALI